MSKEWHLLRAEEKFGPYDWEEICAFSKEGRLLAGDLLWSPSLGAWTKAAEVPGLPPPASSGTASSRPGSPETAAPGAPGAHPVSGPAGSAPTPGVKPTSKGSGGCLTVFLVVFGIFVLLAVVGGGIGAYLLFVSGDEPGPVAATERASTPATAEGSASATGEDDPLVRPWIHSFKTERGELSVGASTRLTLDVRDPGGAGAYRVDWESSCGAAAPSPQDQTRAVFLAPARPGWCRVKATLVESPRRSSESTIDILVTPDMSGDLGRGQ